MFKHIQIEAKSSVFKSFNKPTEDLDSFTLGSYTPVEDIEKFKKELEKSDIDVTKMYTTINNQIKECFKGTPVLDKEKDKIKMIPNELLVVHLTKSLVEEVESGKVDLEKLNEVGLALSTLGSIKH